MDRSDSRFGLTDQQWEDAKTEVRDAILEAAYERRMTWYGEIASQVSVVPLDPYSALMNYLLGAVFEDEWEAGGSFYEKARSLGYRFNEPYVFWAQQVQDVFKRYGKANRYT